jgi:hypothetical protein
MNLRRPNTVEASALADWSLLITVILRYRARLNNYFGLVRILGRLRHRGLTLLQKLDLSQSGAVQQPYFSNTSRDAKIALVTFSTIQLLIQGFFDAKEVRRFAAGLQRPFSRLW